VSRDQERADRRRSARTSRLVQIGNALLVIAIRSN
jgi:hypothetical protein